MLYKVEGVEFWICRALLAEVAPAPTTCNFAVGVPAVVAKYRLLPCIKKLPSDRIVKRFDVPPPSKNEPSLHRYRRAASISMLPETIFRRSVGLVVPMPTLPSESKIIRCTLFVLKRSDTLFVVPKKELPAVAALPVNPQPPPDGVAGAQMLLVPFHASTWPAVALACNIFEGATVLICTSEMLNAAILTLSTLPVPNFALVTAPFAIVAAALPGPLAVTSPVRAVMAVVLITLLPEMAMPVPAV